MSIPLDLALVALGGVLLYFGAEWLVRGASTLAAALGVPPLLVGLTVVAYGTSAPELAVSMVAAVNDQSDIALGNVLGSNVANGGLVLGLTALIAPPRVPPRLWRLELPWLWAASLALPALLLDGRISRGEGIAFLLAALTFSVVSLRAMRKGRVPVTVDVPDDLNAADDPSVDGDSPVGKKRSVRTGRLAALILVGLFALSFGGKCFVEGSVSLARALGIDDLTIGLTLVAFGTSLPELAASIVAALRGHSEMAIGNVLGSNLFNILLIIGAASAVRPIVVSFSELTLNLGFLGALTLVTGVSMSWSRRISRLEGALFVTAYLAFIGAQVFKS
jgi:cation:H+ antiporter